MPELTFIASSYDAGEDEPLDAYSKAVTTPYPFQANTYGLPQDVVAECVLGYFRAQEAQAKGSLSPPTSFEDFIRQRMGDGIAGGGLFVALAQGGPAAGGGSASGSEWTGAGEHGGGVSPGHRARITGD